jgi:hypothetical protein
VIIDKLGDYRMRNGRKARIRALDGYGSFPVKGSIYKEYRGYVAPRGHMIWMINGRAQPLIEHPLDLMEFIE